MNLIPPSIEMDQRFVIHGLDWAAYNKILEALGDRHIFVTYDRGSLEFMSPSSFHEVCKIWLRRVPEIAAEELDLPFYGLGSTTMRSEEADRGLEPDECYYFSRPPTIAPTPLDLDKEPPPDLVIEIDISRSSLDRQGIYAVFGVPELWRFNGNSLEFYCLARKREYEAKEYSVRFPWLDSVELLELLRDNATEDHLTLGRRVRALVRRQIAAHRKKTGKGRKRNSK